MTIVLTSDTSGARGGTYELHKSPPLVGALRHWGTQYAGSKLGCCGFDAIWVESYDSKSDNWAQLLLLLHRYHAK